MSTIIANNIKYLRRMNGLTQEQFSRKIGIKRSLLGAYEEGRANPNLDNLTNIAKIFGTTVDNLIKNDIRNLREKQGVPLPQPAPNLLEPNDPTPPKPIGSLIDRYYQQPEVVTPLPPVAQPTPPAVKPEPPPVIPPPVELFPKATPSQAARNAPETPVWVSQQIMPEYLTGYAYKDFLEKLPGVSLPMLPPGKYRAFEAGADFPVSGATVVGEHTPNWFDIRDGAHYLLVLHKQGVVYRRVYNHVKVKGTLLLLSDLPTVPVAEVPVKDVLELWEVRLYLALGVPEPPAALPLERLATLVGELQREVDSLRK